MFFREAEGKPLALAFTNDSGAFRCHYRPFDWQAAGLVSWANEVEFPNFASIPWRTYMPPSPPRGAMGRTDYLELVRKAMRLAAESNGKVVTSRVELLDGDLDPGQVFEDLCEAYPGLNVHLFFHPYFGVWVGATPEVLLELHHGQIRAMSLAGTQQVGHPTIGEKERQEQALVTQQLVSHFEQLGVRNTATGPLELFQAGPVEHLLTWVSGSWSGSAEEALQLLHPTPAVCGYPREKARNFIATEEGYSRQFYTGYFGLETVQGSRFYVNLRCASFWQKGVALYAGGGITSASIPEQEWDETVRKMTTLERVMKRSQ